MTVTVKVHTTTAVDVTVDAEPSKAIEAVVTAIQEGVRALGVPAQVRLADPVDIEK